MLTYLPLEATTITERLKKEARYATGFVGKWHPPPPRMADECIAFLEKNSQGSFFSDALELFTS